MEMERERRREWHRNRTPEQMEMEREWQAANRAAKRAANLATLDGLQDIESLTKTLNERLNNVRE